jgi:hypothetical protein
MDYLHDVAAEQNRTYTEVMRDFQQRGCEALGESHGEGESNPYADALYDLLGDDLDGAAAMMEDFPNLFG